MGWCLYPLDSVANLFNGIDKRADVAGDVVEEVDGRHGDGVIYETKRAKISATAKDKSQ